MMIQTKRMMMSLNDSEAPRKSLDYETPAPPPPNSERMPRWLEITQIVLLIVGPILMFLFARRR